MIIQRGVPWRHGICKRRVEDGPKQYPQGIILHDCVKFPGQMSLECRTPYQFGRFMVGEKEDSFLITTSVETYLPSNVRSYHCFGFFELWKSLWTVSSTHRCSHSTRLGASLELQPGWMTITLKGHLHLQNYQSLNIFLTAGCPAARWNAILSLADSPSRASLRGHRIFLRSLNTCLKCATEEAARHTPYSFLVL